MPPFMLLTQDVVGGALIAVCLGLRDQPRLHAGVRQVTKTGKCVPNALSLDHGRGVAAEAYSEAAKRHRKWVIGEGFDQAIFLESSRGG